VTGAISWAATDRETARRVARLKGTQTPAGILVSDVAAARDIILTFEIPLLVL
jgi:hypothetical protein